MGEPTREAPAGVRLILDTEALRPLIRAVVAEVIAEVGGARGDQAGPVAYSEPEAARLLGLEPHVLRDERRRGRIAASQIVGRRVRYTLADLQAYLQERRVNGG